MRMCVLAQEGRDWAGPIGGVRLSPRSLVVQQGLVVGSDSL